ncbi:hypothetical protein BDA96_10G135700 [Sorghum bicolor]|uniref:Uncharacterized protein n=1 Tax=Sorghum bicolor TaxID=4558 RepID=A0A921Q4X8_SORBI|nr:hypothetical protein BDA96_10G135700 [Sorghum bicolor]
MAHVGNQTESCSCCTIPFWTTKYGYLYDFGLAKKLPLGPDSLLRSNQSGPCLVP